MAARVVQVVLGTVGLTTYVVLTPLTTRSAVGLVENALPLGMLFVAGVIATARQPRHRAARRMLAGGTVAVAGLGLGALVDLTWPDGRASWLGWAVAIGTVLSQDLGLA